MTDFLNRLASRALGVAPVIQPRPRSRFEPEPATPPGVDAMAPADAVGSAASPRAAASAASPRAVGSAASPRAVGSAASPRMGPMRRAPQATATPGSRRPPVPATPPALPGQMKPEAIGQVQIEPPQQPDARIDFAGDPAPAVSPAGRTQPVGSSAVIVPAGPPAEPPAPQQAPRAADTATLSVRQPNADWAAKADYGPEMRRARPIAAPEGSDEAALASAVLPAALASAVLPAGIPPQAVWPLHPAAAARIAAAPAAVSATAADQNIIIEIGSIELRTQPAAAPPAAPPQRSGPALSLDAYLTRRQAG